MSHRVYCEVRQGTEREEEPAELVWSRGNEPDGVRKMCTPYQHVEPQAWRAFVALQWLMHR
jgi:hypothetical protein